jgi:hypothetical protein
MDAITLSVQIPPDHHLVLDLPADIPVGTAEVTIKPQGVPVAETEIINPAREAARAKLLAAGILSTAHRAPEGTVALSDEELQRLGRALPDATPLDKLIDEDRGPR